MANWYYIIGDDQHGPVGDEDIQQMLATGELQTDDLVWQAGMSDWVEVGEAFAVGDIHETAAEELAEPDGVSAAPESMAPAPESPAALYGPSDTPQPITGETFTPSVERGERQIPGASATVWGTGQTHPLAIASIVLAIAGFFTCFSAIPAVVVGHMALSQINREPERYGGKPLAVAGLVIGYVLLLPTLLFIALMFLGLFAA